MSARSALAARGDADLSYGAGRQASTMRQCFGCARRLRRTTTAAIFLCGGCHRVVSTAYTARLRASGLTPTPSDPRWSQAWNQLADAINSGDKALVRALLAEGR